MKQQTSGNCAVPIATCMTFVQDGASAHATKATQAWCQKKPVKFYRENMLAPKFPRY